MPDPGGPLTALPFVGRERDTAVLAAALAIREVARMFTGLARGGDVVPGFRCRIAELFSDLRR